MPTRLQGRGNYWEHHFNTGTERRQAAARPAGDRACARGDWCLDRTIDTASGERKIIPAPAYQAFCLRDRADIIADLRELPGLYLRIAYELGQTGGTGETVVITPFGPQLPIRIGGDAVMRMTVATLGSWEARVRRIARLTAPDPAARRDTPAAVRDTARTLADHVDVLLALQPGWMTRTIPLPRNRKTGGGQQVRDAAGFTVRTRGEWDPAADKAWEPYADMEIVKVGVDYLTVMQQLGGAQAGLEIIHLRYLARSVLGETNVKPEDLLGVACYQCNLRLLRRADPPQHDGDELWYSQCKACRHRMTEPDYREHVQRLAAQHGGRRRTPVLDG